MSPFRQIRIVVADDHPMFREGMVVVLSNQPDMVVLGEYDNGSLAVQSIIEQAPDVAILDLKMPGMDGIAATVAILEKWPTCLVLILTSYNGGGDIQRAMRAGARGYILKESSKEEILHAIREVAEGRFYLSQAAGASFAKVANIPELTPRERETLKLISEGMANKAIGAVLGVTEGTVKSHVNAIMQKLKAGSRTEVALIALHNGLLRS